VTGRLVSFGSLVPLVLTLVLGGLPTLSQALGQTGAELLRLQGDAHYTILGSAATGLKQGLSALAGNPAALDLESWAASVTHYTGFLGLQLQAGSFGQRLEDGKVWAVGVTSARLGDLEGRDVAGHPTSIFDTQTWILSYAGAIPLTPQLTVGVGARTTSASALSRLRVCWDPSDSWPTCTS